MRSLLWQTDFRGALRVSNLRLPDGQPAVHSLMPVHTFQPEATLQVRPDGPKSKPGNQVLRRSVSALADPVLSLTIWLHRVLTGTCGAAGVASPATEAAGSGAGAGASAAVPSGTAAAAGAGALGRRSGASGCAAAAATGACAGPDGRLTAPLGDPTTAAPEVARGTGCAASGADASAMGTAAAPGVGAWAAPIARGGWYGAEAALVELA